MDSDKHYDERTVAQAESIYAYFFDAEDSSHPYPSAEAELHDYMQLVSLLAWVYSEENHNEEAPYIGRGLAVREEQFYAAMLPAEPEPFPDAQQALRHIQTRSEQQRDGGVLFSTLCESFSLSDFESFCLLLALCPDLDRKYESMFGFLQNDGAPGRPTLGLAHTLYQLVRPVPAAELYAILDRECCLNRLLLLDWEEDHRRSQLTRPLVPQPRVLYQLLPCTPPLTHPLPRFCESLTPTTEPSFLPTEATAHAALQIGAQLKAPAPARLLFYLFGEAEVGKTFLLSDLSRTLSCRFLPLDLSQLLTAAPSVQAQAIRTYATQCRLDHAIPCLDRLVDTPGMLPLVKELIRWLQPHFSCIVVLGLAAFSFESIPGLRLQTMELKRPSEVARLKLWDFALAERSLVLRDVSTEELAGRFRLTPGEIFRLVARLEDHYDTGGPSTLRQISEALQESAQRRLGSIAMRMTAAFTWEDVALPKTAEDSLRAAVSRMKHQYQVNMNWGFGRKLPYGRGVSILLYGPPGTGKTMTAQVLANALETDLFRIDLSQIVDKYIGETEKKLSKLFDVAESSNCILFFDEADALFSKRTDVKDAKDKYANVETSYLLQRIEQYNGLSLLATNHPQNFDEAFRRRMTYCVSIPLPQKETRQKIWEAVFPAETPTKPNLPFEELAERFELSGSSIKSAAITAAYMAADKDSMVDRRALLEAIREENAKYGRLLDELSYL